MKPSTLSLITLLTLSIGISLACGNAQKAPDVSGGIRHALDQAGLNDVKVSQDRDQGVVDLTGKVGSDDDKARAESIARSIAGSEVFSTRSVCGPARTQALPSKWIQTWIRA
jgi:hyperosmotically inducible periplasmic protein